MYKSLETTGKVSKRALPYKAQDLTSKEGHR